MPANANAFFQDLLKQTKEQFEKSDVFHRQIELRKNWNYAICATPIRKHKGVIFGINWGGDDMNAQTAMPSGDAIRHYRFIKQCKAFLEAYWGISIEAADFNYSNLCFFRTPKEKYLSQHDYELSLPLFEKYIHYIQPPWILSIGNKNMQMLEHFGVLKNKQRHYDRQNDRWGHSGLLWDYRLFSVPHPGARLTSASRKEIWEAVSREMRKWENQVSLV